MTSRLVGVPIASRRRIALTTGVFATLFAVITVVTSVGDGPAGSTAFTVVAAIAAVALGLLAWGVARSIAIDRDSARLDASLDAAIASSLAEHPQQSCGCGHEHDPDELHVTDACDHDGTGAACAHDCQTCVLAGMKRADAG